MEDYSFSEESWRSLKRNGFVFLRAGAFARAFDAMQEEVENGNFDRRVPAMSPFEGFKSAEDFSNHESPLQRDSWYLSRRYAGPFAPSKVKAVFEAAEPIWRSVLRRVAQEVPALSYKANETIGFHRYYSESEKTGLAAHKDSGAVTVLASTGALEGWMDGRWEPILIPDEHVMVFIGSICELLDKDYHPLLHRVSQVRGRKISLGLFLDPAGTDELLVDGVRSGKMVADYHRAYFSLDRNAYPRFLKSIGRPPAHSY